jgi:hypothetical protein
MNRKRHSTAANAFEQNPLCHQAHAALEVEFPAISPRDVLHGA